MTTQWNRLAGMVGLLMLVLAACASPTPTATPTATQDQGNGLRQVEVGRPFTVRAGGQVEVVTAFLVLTFKGVAQDSRCASDVTCVTAGSATLEVLARAQGGESATLSLTLGGDATAEFSGYTITVLDLSPYPVSTKTIEPHEYEAMLVVKAS